MVNDSLSVKLNARIRPSQEAFLDRCVEEGTYSSWAAVVREGLDLLLEVEEREAELVEVDDEVVVLRGRGARVFQETSESFGVDHDTMALMCTMLMAIHLQIEQELSEDIDVLLGAVLEEALRPYEPENQES